jgi:Kef-type K+ transport system membrane component KefB
MIEGLGSLLVILVISAVVPIGVGLLHIRVTGVVFLLLGGIICGPYALDWIHIDAPVELLAELGLAMLFFIAGIELDFRVLRGPAGRLAAIGWGLSMTVAIVLSTVFVLTGRVVGGIAMAIAVSSTALGTLLPGLRDDGQLHTRFGRLFVGAGAWGEFGPIFAMALLLSTRSSAAAALTLVMFAIIVLIIAIIPSRLMSRTMRRLWVRGHTTSSQTPVRLTLAFIVGMLVLAAVLDLDIILGAFIAGIIVRRYLPPGGEVLLERKIEAIGFGFLIPVFFVVSGAKLNISSIVENPLRLIAFTIVLVVARGLPQFFLYWRALPRIRERTRFSLLVATGLPIIVAVTNLEVQAGVMLPSTAAALVGAGMVSVLVFPALGDWIDPPIRSARSRQPADD